MCIIVNVIVFSSSAGISGEGKAALGEGEEPAEGQHRREQGENVKTGELLDRGPDPLPHRQRTPEGGPGPVPDSGEEVQQSQEAHQGLPAEVSAQTYLETITNQINAYIICTKIMERSLLAIGMNLVYLYFFFFKLT